MKILSKTKIACVYAITSKINGHRYIGSTIDFSKRSGSHIYALRHGVHVNKLLQKDWDKYGEDNFLFGIVAVVNKPDFVLSSEQAWLDGFSPQYNVFRSSGSRAGSKTPESVKAKLRTKTLRRYEEGWTAFSGKKHSPKTKALMSSQRLGRKPSLETKIKLSEAAFKMWTPERRKQKSALVRLQTRLPNGLFQGELKTK